MPPTCFSLPFGLLRASAIAAKLLKSAIAEVRYGGLCTDTSAAAVKLRQRLGVSLGKLNLAARVVDTHTTACLAHTTPPAVSAPPSAAVTDVAPPLQAGLVALTPPPSGVPEPAQLRRVHAGVTAFFATLQGAGVAMASTAADAAPERALIALRYGLDGHHSGLVSTTVWCAWVVLLCALESTAHHRSAMADRFGC